MILSWLPPLLFSLMVSNGIDPKVSDLLDVSCHISLVSSNLNLVVIIQWGMLAMAGFEIFAALLLAVGTGKWEDILLESGRSERQDADTENARDVEIPDVE